MNFIIVLCLILIFILLLVLYYYKKSNKKTEHLNFNLWYNNEAKTAVETYIVSVLDNNTKLLKYTIKKSDYEFEYDQDYKQSSIYNSYKNNTTNSSKILKFYNGIRDSGILVSDSVNNTDSLLDLILYYKETQSDTKDNTTYQILPYELVNNIVCEYLKISGKTNMNDKLIESLTTKGIINTDFCTTMPSGNSNNASDNVYVSPYYEPAIINVKNKIIEILDDTTKQLNIRDNDGSFINYRNTQKYRDYINGKQTNPDDDKFNIYLSTINVLKVDYILNDIINKRENGDNNFLYKDYPKELIDEIICAYLNTEGVPTNDPLKISYNNSTYILTNTCNIPRVRPTSTTPIVTTQSLYNRSGLYKPAINIAYEYISSLPVDIIEYFIVDKDKISTQFNRYKETGNLNDLLISPFDEILSYVLLIENNWEEFKLNFDEDISWNDYGLKLDFYNVALCIYLRNIPNPDTNTTDPIKIFTTETSFNCNNILTQDTVIPTGPTTTKALKTTSAQTTTSTPTPTTRSTTSTSTYSWMYWFAIIILIYSMGLKK